MPENGEENCRIEGLPPALVEMSQYLDRLEQGCTDLVDHFHSDRAASLNKLAQVIEGLEYCLQLLRSAAILLAGDVTQEEHASAVSFQEAVSRFFADINQAAAGEDYSLLADLIEYDLPSYIQNGQTVIQMFYRHCLERNV